MTFNVTEHLLLDVIADALMTNLRLKVESVLAVRCTTSTISLTECSLSNPTSNSVFYDPDFQFVLRL